jgi:hypothetical protein
VNILKSVVDALESVVDALENNGRSVKQRRRSQSSAGGKGVFKIQDFEIHRRSQTFRFP